MKIIDRMISFVFSLVMLALSIILILTGIGIVAPENIIEIIENYVFESSIISQGIFNPITIAGIVLLLLSLKTTIFISKNNNKSPIIVTNKSGDVQISQDTIVSTARNIVFTYKEIKDAKISMTKKGKKGVVIYVIALVYSNTNIKDLISDMQNEILETIDSSIGVKVLKVNIKVKNVYGKTPVTETPKPHIEEKEIKKDNNSIDEVKFIDKDTIKLDNKIFEETTTETKKEEEKVEADDAKNAQEDKNEDEASNEDSKNESTSK